MTSIGIRQRLRTSIERLTWRRDLARQVNIVQVDPEVEITDLKPMLMAFGRWSVLNCKEHRLAADLIARVRWSDHDKQQISLQLCRALQVALAFRNGGASYLWNKLIVLIATSFGLCMLYAFEPNKLGFPLFFTGAMIALTVEQFYEANGKTHQCRLLLDSLGILAQPESLGAIATACKNQHLRCSAKDAFIEVVKSVRPEYRSTVPDETVTALCKALSIADNETVELSLRSLFVVGDGRAIKSVERLLLNAPTKKIGALALELLPILRQRQIESKSPAQVPMR